MNKKIVENRDISQENRDTTCFYVQSSYLTRSPGRYLQVEWRARRGCCRVFTVDTMRSGQCRVAQQNNSSDCGVFLLQYAESFLKVPSSWIPENLSVVQSLLHPAVYSSPPVQL